MMKQEELLTMDEVNGMEQEVFVKTFGPLFEHSPWVAERAWKKKPFAQPALLLEAMRGVLSEATEAERTALLVAHPDLAGRLARSAELTTDSAHEQAAAGLDGISAEQVVKLQQLNAAYRLRFGFPFIICARLNRVETILTAFENRRENERGMEVATALAEIGKIAALRLAERVTA